MQTDRATALAAADRPEPPEAAQLAPAPGSADSFRRLTARLKGRPVAALPVSGNVIPLRKALPRLVEAESRPEPPPIVIAAETVPEPPPIVVAAEIVPEPPPAAVAAEPEPEPPSAAVASEPDRDAGEEAGDTAITVLEVMTAATSLLPQERALASDTILLLLPRMPLRQMIRLAERVAIMDSPPPLLVERLIRDPRPEIMGPVLERSPNLSDPDMIAAAPLTDFERLRMIARRRALSPVLSGHLAASGDPEVILPLLRNTGAELPHQCFAGLCALAAQHPVLLAPLATRSELPPEVAFELCWHLPPELRRLVLSRFLTDSGTLGQILKTATAEDAKLTGAALRGEGSLPQAEFEAALAAAVAGSDDAARRFAELAGIAEATATRILEDQHGEPSVVLFKALGVSRSRFIEALAKFGAHDGGGAEDLQAVFDGLSFTKARMLLTYWDWFTRKVGPYAGWGAAQPRPLVEMAGLA